jgi:hypothetical protein
MQDISATLEQRTVIKAGGKASRRAVPFPLNPHVTNSNIATIINGRIVAQ